MSVGDYLRDVRLRAALERLVDGDVPLVDVALASGFSDQSRLTKVIKRATGMTPGELRSFVLQRRRAPR